ncbi:MAG: T9SS type A sorting domain-containing protein [Bacteroidota bacterium]
MNIFTQSRIFIQSLLTLFALLTSVVSGLGQFCLGYDLRGDEAVADEVFFDVTAKEFKGIVSFQFSLLYDDDVYEYIGFVGGNIEGFTDRSFNPDVGEGAIAVAWFDRAALGVSYDDDAPLFTLKFRQIKESGDPFQFTDDPTAIEVAVCDETGCDVIFNFTNCETGENLAPAMQGQLYLDTSEDCTFQTNETESTFTNGWRGWNVLSEQDGKYHLSGNLKSDGSYNLRLFPGENEVEILAPSPYYDLCEPTFNFNADDLDLTEVVRSGVQIREFCPFLEVNLSSFPVRPCESAYYFLEYANNGTAAAENVYVELDLDYRLEVTTLDENVVDLGNNQYRLDVGSLAIGENGGFFMSVNVPCDLSEMEMLRNEARIFPNEICGTLNEVWSGASLRVNGQCNDNKVTFEIKNVGDGDMVQPLEYIVIEDGVIFRSESLQLAQGRSKTVSLDATGASYFIQMPQEKGHPGSSKPSAFIEACGRDANGQFSTGFANRFPEENNDVFVDVDYQTLAGFTNRNRMLSSPIGYADRHFIEPNTPIEYTLFFANSNQTLEITDSLSALLDVSTFRPVAANRPYAYTLEEDVLKLTVEPARINNPRESSGYIKFSITPRANLPMGSVVTNKASITTAGRAATEVTNEVFHTIMDDFLETSVSTISIFKEENLATAFPNPSNDVVVFTLQDIDVSDYQLSIFNVDGKVIEQTTFQSQQYEFRKGDLPAGTYLYRLVNRSGQVDNGLFILID